jgi:hypothetical protein
VAGGPAGGGEAGADDDDADSAHLVLSDESIEPEGDD